jgi:hypothetical protein
VRVDLANDRRRRRTRRQGSGRRLRMIDGAAEEAGGRNERKSRALQGATFGEARAEGRREAGPARASYRAGRSRLTAVGSARRFFVDCAPQ